MPPPPGVRTAIRQARAELVGVRFLPAPRYYPCRDGTLSVYSARSKEDGDQYVAGRFEGVLRDDSGRVLRRYWHIRPNGAPVPLAVG